MPDREKVIKGLLCCAHTDGINCVYCPYDNTDEDCTALMSMDVLNLLKEQEADKPKGHWIPYDPERRGYTDGFACSRCERIVFLDHFCKMIDFDFCPYCGACMDDAEGR